MLAIIGAKIHTISMGNIDRGVIIIRDGLIEAVGDHTLEIPVGCGIVDATGGEITPGLIDAHSHIGIFGEVGVPATADGNEMIHPVTPEIRGLDSFNPDDPAIPLSLQGGVTTVYTGPGGVNVVGGTWFAIKTDGQTACDFVTPSRGAMKFALGENTKNHYSLAAQKPKTRMGAAAIMRKALMSAQDYLGKRAHAEAKRLPFERDLGLEELAKVLTREYVAKIHAHRADDIMTAIRISEEFGLDYSIEHCTEGYIIADILAEKGCFCLIGPLQMAPTKQEVWGLKLETPGILSRAGVKVIITMDGASPASSNTKYLALNAGLAVRYGMDEEEALRAITLNPAELMGIADRLGSIEPGKEADIVIYDGHPLSNFTNVKEVFIAGKSVYKVL